jgi:hypothetical protein
MEKKGEKELGRKRDLPTRESERERERELQISFASLLLDRPRERERDERTERDCEIN